MPFWSSRLFRFYGRTFNFEEHQVSVRLAQPGKRIEKTWCAFNQGLALLEDPFWTEF